MSDFSPSDMLRSETPSEFFEHSERADGTRDLIFGPLDGSGDHGHAVIDPSGNPLFIRETDGRVIADDSN